MPTQFDPPSGTRDFLAADVEKRERAFAVIRSVFSRYGFEPLQTPAFERLDVLLGKYGEEGDKLIFKILRRGEHEASGEADLALRYDMTVPLARVAAAYGSQLPTPYKRYAMGPVWRADRPGRGRFREFVQCDLDTLGTASVLADAEVICAVHDTLAELGVPDFRFLLNSRHVLAGLLEAFGVPGELGPGVLITLDKLDKLSAAEVAAELTGRGLASAHRGGPGLRPDRPGRGRPDPGRAQAGRGGRGRARRGGRGAVAGTGADPGRPHRVHPPPGPRAELLHRPDLGSRGGRGTRVHLLRRPLRPPDRAAGRPGRAGHRRVTGHRADPPAAARRRPRGPRRAAGRGRHHPGRGVRARAPSPSPRTRAGRACAPACTWARRGSWAASSSGRATRAPAGR